MSHDQNFKNLILDYPRQALAFFAPQEAAKLPPEVRFIPVRQEQLQERLGERFRALDTPILVEWPDQHREAILFLVEEETEVRRFSVYRLVCYCAQLAELLNTDRVVPVVIFLRPGSYRPGLELGTEHTIYLSFRYIACDLGRIPADPYLDSDNIVARLNLPNLAYRPEQRLEVFLRAQEGLARLESNLDKQIKYSAFIDQYANLSEAELTEYFQRYLPCSLYKEQVMGFTQYRYEQGLKQGFEQGARQEIMESIELGLELKFGASGLALMSEIRNIGDLDTLRRVRGGIKQAGSLEELRRRYRPFQEH